MAVVIVAMIEFFGSHGCTLQVLPLSFLRFCEYLCFLGREAMSGFSRLFLELSGILSCDWWRQGHVINSVWFFPAFQSTRHNVLCSALPVRPLFSAMDLLYGCFTRVALGALFDAVLVRLQVVLESFVVFL